MATYSFATRGRSTHDNVQRNCPDVATCIYATAQDFNAVSFQSMTASLFCRLPAFAHPRLRRFSNSPERKRRAAQQTLRRVRIRAIQKTGGVVRPSTKNAPLQRKVDRFGPQCERLQRTWCAERYPGIIDGLTQGDDDLATPLSHGTVGLRDRTSQSRNPPCAATLRP